VPDTAPVVALRGVQRGFGDVVALADFTLEVPPGTVTMLLGPNGAGKTTAIRMVTGALAPHSGTVHVFGLDPAHDGTEVRRRIGVVPAKPALYDRLTGRDNLLYAARLYEVAGEAAAIERAAERFRIEHALDQFVGGYSTGMKARLALARATLHDPELLLLDEPTAGLDPESSRAVLALIGEMAATGRTVLMCTHLLLEAEGLADHVLVMDSGSTLVAGNPRDLTRTYWQSPTVLVDAEGEGWVAILEQLACVSTLRREPAGALVEVDDPDHIPDVVAALTRAGIRVRRVEPREPSLEELYFAVRRAQRATAQAEGTAAGEVPMLPPDPPVRREAPR
jgi:ABC-2 type transport system ATP-binding protein